MRKIYAIGETLYDIIFKDGEPRAGKPGGAMLNSAVSLGRIGLPVSLISEYGVDDIGMMIDGFLSANGVDTSWTDHYTDGKTALAIAVLNERSDASYTFYKSYPRERLKMNFPVTAPDDLVLYGSIYAVTNDIRLRFLDFIKGSEETGALLIYDPNFRKSHLHELDILRPMIIENMKYADMVRGSDEDFENIFGVTSPDQAWEAVRHMTFCLVYTASKSGVYVFTNRARLWFPVHEIEPVSTIGAGDNFNAGMIAAIHRLSISKGDLQSMNEDLWKKVINSGIEFATHVCLSYDNYIGSAFASRYLSASSDQI